MPESLGNLLIIEGDAVSRRGTLSACVAPIRGGGSANAARAASGDEPTA